MPFRLSTRLFARLALAGFVVALAATPVMAAETYQATGTRGGSPVQKASTMLQEIYRSQTGQAVYVFALPKQH